jgi:hypothetical protein
LCTTHLCRYSTGLGLSGSDALIQDFYSGECTNPIHLILDTQLTDGKMAIKAFVSRTLTLRKHQVGYTKGHYGTFSFHATVF